MPDEWSKRLEERRRHFADLACAAVSDPPAFVRDLATRSPKISVIVRSAGRRSTLPMALRSLANQTAGAFEVVFVSDGGAFDPLVLEEHGAGLAIQVVTLKPAQGRTAALNAGLAQARGELITYLDDDDILYPDHISILASQFEQHPGTQAAYTLANKTLVDESGVEPITVCRLPFHVRPFESSNLLVDNFIPIVSLMHKADCVDRIGVFDTNFDVFEDWDFIIRLAGHAKLHRIPRFTWEYRFRSGGEDATNVIVNAPRERIEAARQIYAKHATGSRSIDRARRRKIADLRRAADRLERISRSPGPAALRSAALVGGFPWPPAQAPAPRSSPLAARTLYGLAPALVSRIATRLARHSDRAADVMRRSQAVINEEIALGIDDSPRS